MPTTTLSVKPESAQGLLSMYGWVNSVRTHIYNYLFMFVDIELYSAVILW
jgi:hypothetical protein